MRKRGAGNIEFVLAFILFISFIVSAIYFFNPVRSTEVLQSSMTYTLNEIMRNTSVSVDYYSVKVAPKEGVTAVEIKGVDTAKNVRVESYEGRVLPSRRDGNLVHFEKTNETFVIVQFSEDFEESSFGATGTLGSYKVASFVSSSLISEKRFARIKEVYESDYSSLKEQRSIPSGIDFSFRLDFANGDSIAAETNAPLRVEVFSETRIREVLKKDGTSEFAYLTAKIW